MSCTQTDMNCPMGTYLAELKIVQNATTAHIWVQSASGSSSSSSAVEAVKQEWYHVTFMQIVDGWHAEV